MGRSAARTGSARPTASSSRGTRAFMAAEAFLGEVGDFVTWRCLTSRDWYSLGCCLMLMLLGTRGTRLSPQRAVLLPPPQEDLRATMEQYSAELGPAFSLLLALTADSVRERAGACEVRVSPFLQRAIIDAEVLVA